MKDFLFFFLFQNLKFVPERDPMLITCAQQVAVIYCESHESVAEIKAGEPAGDRSLSGIESVGGLPPRVFTE